MDEGLMLVENFLCTFEYFRPPQLYNYLSELRPQCRHASYLFSKAHGCMRVALCNCEGHRKISVRGYPLIGHPPLLVTLTEVGPSENLAKRHHDP